MSTAALEHSMAKPSSALLPKFTSKPTSIGGDAAEIRLSGIAIRDVALANSNIVVEHQRNGRTRDRERAAAQAIQQDERCDHPVRSTADHQQEYRHDQG